MNTIQNTLINKTSIAWTSLLIFTLSSIPTSAQTTDTIRDILKKTTVQINTDANPGGSGVIIKKEGNTYSVLTANHVVCENLGRENIRCRTDFTYTIRTHDGREYPIEERQILQTKVQDPDLAIVTFESEQDYEIAPLGNSSQVNIQSDIFVAGFPTIFGRVGKDRSFTITNGKVVTFIDNPPKGYGLIYDATTRIGNSGGPVFDTEGKVIGIHGLADTDSLESDNTNQSETRNNLRPNPSTIRKLINPQTESGGSFQIKTGFNAGIPINILYGVLPQNYFNARFTPSTTRPEPSSIPVSVVTTPQLVAPTEVSNYQVKPDDTLVEIAGSYGTSVAEIIQANGLSDPHDLQVNQQLIIPQVKSGIGLQVTSPVVIPPKRGAQIAISPLVPPDPEANLPSATELPFPSSDRNSEEVAVTVPQIPSPSSGSAIILPVAGKNQVTTPKGIGGSTDEFTTTVAIAPKTVPTQLKKVTPNNDRLRSLQAEIERLRQKYRDQRSAITLANSGKVDNTPSPLGGRNPVTIAVPRLTDSEMGVDAIAPNDEPVKPQFVPGDTRRNPSSIKLNVPSRRMNPRDSLGKKQGTTVSPALPPFALVDTYVNNANGYIKQGVIRSELGDKRGAIANYDQAIKLNPNLADAYYKRGLVQSELGNKKAAIADFQKAANLYKKQGKKNNHRDALNRIRKIQKRQPRFNSATGTSSRSFYNPNPSQSNSINVNRGNTRYNLGDYRGAIDDYNQAIKLDPKNALAYNNRGAARSDLGDNQGAIDDYNQALKLHPNYANAYIGRGIARSDLGDNQGAIDDFTQAIKLDPKNALAYNNRGNARGKLGDNQGAIDDYNQALKLDPKNALAYNNRGAARSDLGDNQGAIDDFTQAIKLHPNYANAYIGRGIAQSDLGDNQAAIDDFTQAIKLDPNYAKAYGNRGIARGKLGDKQGAIADLQKAADLFQTQGRQQDYFRALDIIRKIR